MENPSGSSEYRLATVAGSAMACGRRREHRRLVHGLVRRWMEDDGLVLGPLVLAVEQRALLRVMGRVRVAAHPQVDVVVVHAAAGVALVFVDEVLLQERHVDLLAPRAVQVVVLCEGDRVLVGAHATGVLVDAGVSDGGTGW